MSRLVSYEKKKIDTIQMRISVDEKEDWKVMAELRGHKNLSDYLRDLVISDMQRIKWVLSEEQKN